MEERIGKHKEKSIEIIQSEKREKAMSKYEQSFRDLWDTIKCANLCVIEVPEGKKRKGQKNIWRTNAQKLLKFGEKHHP